MTAEFQARGGEQGRAFEELCRLVLRGAGFDVSDKRVVVSELGIEIDIAATNRCGVMLWFECKGSWAGRRPGLLRTDSVKKAVLSGLLAHVAPGDYPDLVILTSHMPKGGLRGDAQIAVALDCGAVRDVICISEPGLLEALAGEAP